MLTARARLMNTDCDSKAFNVRGYLVEDHEDLFVIAPAIAREAVAAVRDGARVVLGSPVEHEVIL